MIFIVLGVGLIAAIVESYLDRHGESKAGKLKDGIWLTITALAVSLIACYLGGVNPLKTIALILGVRILVFDYLVHAFLKRFSEGHKDINIWTYVGTTSKIDRLVSKVNPFVRLGVRVALFVAAVVWFLHQPR